MANRNLPTEIEQRPAYLTKYDPAVLNNAEYKVPGGPHLIAGGIDREYFRRKLDHFERFLNAAVERGAVSIYWA